MVCIIMTKATVRDLRYAFPAVLSRLEHGEAIAITKRGKVVARLMPPPSARATKRKRPNFSERIREIYGKRRTDNFVQWYVENRE
jgi:antitoxin (DNA-binding transcriptional repressor) of toxin-antitoxin stability system